MGVGGPGSVSAPAAGDVEGMIREAEGLSAALRRARAFRLLLFLGLLGLVAAIVWSFYRLGSDLMSEANQRAILETAQRRLGERSDDYMKQVQTLVNNTSPTLTQAFYDQAKKDLPKYMESFGNERDKLLIDLEKALTERLETRVSAIVEQHKAILLEEFPEIKDREVQERVMANMKEAVEKLAKKYFVEEMHSEVLALYDAWDRFPAVDQRTLEPGSPALADQLIAELLELLRQRLILMDKPGSSGG
jgi:multidrug efflux pump subunit AcrB